MNVVGVNQFAGHQQKFVSKRFQREGLPILRKTKSFEPHRKIVGQKRKFRIKSVGAKMIGWRSGKGEVVFQNPGSSRKIVGKFEYFQP